MDNRKQDELNIFNKYKRTGNKKYFQQLYDNMKGLIYDASKKAAQGSNLPESAHRAYAAQAFHDSLRTFNPKAGAALQTHVYGSVHQKVKRLNYTYQNLGSMPEPRAQKVGLFQTEKENLKGELGRDPSAAELADRLSMPLAEIVNLQKEITKDLSLSDGLDETAFTEGTLEGEVLHNLYFDLTNEEKTVYEYLTGKYGKPKMIKKRSGRADFGGIAMRMGVSESKVRTIHKKIKKKFEKAVR